MIFINQKEYKGTSAVSLALDNEVQSHAVEKGFDVADNIRQQSPAFDVTLTLGGSHGGASRDTEYNQLKTLRDNGTLFTFISELGSYDNIVVKNISPAIERSTNTYSCSLSLVQIRVVELTTQYFTITDIDGSELYSPEKPAGTPPTQALREKDVASEPEKPSGGSWLSGIITWVGGLLG